MRIPRPRWSIAAALVALLVIPGAWLLARDTSTPDGAITTRVKRSDFKVIVTTAGELRAKKFVQIQGRSRRRPTK